MTDKLDGVRGKENVTEDDVVNAHETEVPKNPENDHLDPDPDVVVATGDEEVPVSNADHKRSIKSIYDKTRKNRELVMREDEEAHPDVERIRRLTEEAAGGKTPEQGLDTNDGDHRSQRDRDEHRARAEEERTQRTEEPERGTETEPETTSASDALPASAPDAMVTVKILGTEHEVPQQDIDDAGGIELYQKNRTANIKLQRAATLEKRAQQAQREAERSSSGDQHKADPPEGGQGKADIKELREELLEAVANGDVKDIDEWIGNRLSHRSEAEREAVREAVQDKPEPTEAERELERSRQEEVREANEMMKSEYSDIMGDPELLGLAQQRFRALAAKPSNAGRSQKEMARQAANSVRRMFNRNPQPKPDPVEQERQTRIQRKRSMPEPSRAASSAPSSEQPKQRVPSNKAHIERLRRRAGQITD